MEGHGLRITEAPEGTPLYTGHRAIWLQEFDPKSQKMRGPRTVIVNGGVDITRHPIWIEGPHLIRKGPLYYLIAAEGGTASGHSEVGVSQREGGRALCSGSV